MIGSYHQACPYSLRRNKVCVSRRLSSYHPTLHRLGKLSHRANHPYTPHIPHWIYMMGRNRRACPYNQRHMGQVFQEDELLLRGWWLSGAEHLLMLVRLVGKSCSRTHSVSSHHPTQEVDHWEHRACHNNDHWNKLQISRRCNMIGSHHSACRYSPTHICRVFQDEHLLARGWCLMSQAEHLLMLVRLMGKSCSRTHSVSSHHPTQEVFHLDDWEHRACRNNDHWNRIQIPRRFYMIGSHHRPCPYSPIHMCQVFQDDHLLLRGWCLTTQVEELLVMVLLMGKSCSRTHSVSSHHPTQEVSRLDDWEHRACQNNDHWNRIQISRMFCMIGSHHQACRYSSRHIHQSGG